MLMRRTQIFHRIALTVLLITLVLPMFASSTNAATQAQIDTAINDGLAWLATQQDLTPGPSYGSWNGPNDPTWTYFPVGTTGLAVLKFEHHAFRSGFSSPFDPAYQYSVNVQAGLDYLFANAYTIPISVQPAGDPDTDGDGIGVYFVSPGGNHRTYETSTAMMAIAASQTPGRVVNVPASPVNGWTYMDVLVDAVDYLAFGQTDPAAGTARGGWSYMENQGASDQSNSGYATLALGHAEAPPPCGFGVGVPGFVKSELNYWIDYIQDDVDGDVNDGGSGYTAPADWVNILKTGHLLYQMAFVGDIAGTPRVVDAVDYMVRHWAAADYTPGWRGPGPPSPGHYQATYAAMKGLHTLSINLIDGIDWQEDFSDVLVAEQTGIPGNPRPWPNTPIYGLPGGGVGVWDQNQVLSTIWALLTLQKVVCIITPPVGGVHVTTNDLGPLLFENALILAASVAVIASAVLTIKALKNRKKR